MRLRSAIATALLGRVLADDVAVELGHDLARGEAVEAASSSLEAGSWMGISERMEGKRT